MDGKSIFIIIVEMYMYSTSECFMRPKGRFCVTTTVVASTPDLSLVTWTDSTGAAKSKNST